MGHEILSSFLGWVTECFEKTVIFTFAWPSCYFMTSPCYEEGTVSGMNCGALSISISYSSFLTTGTAEQYFDWWGLVH